MALRIVHECESEQIDRGQIMLPDTAAARAVIRERLRGFGYEVTAAVDPGPSTREEAQSHINAIHRRAVILFALWVEYHEIGDAMAEVQACACEFNEATAQARDLDKAFQLFDDTHLQRPKTQIGAEVESEKQEGRTRIERWARMLRNCADEHRHERAWPWVVLPVMKRQPYSRILLFSLPSHDSRYNIFLVQPFFLAHQSTLRHTHGVNWSFAGPLGGSRNNHINLLWNLGSAKDPYKCLLKREDFYDGRDVVVVHPRTIHSIQRKAPERGWLAQRLRVEDAVRERNYERLERENRFGEMGCLHLYKPSWTLANNIEDSPFLGSDPAFFERFDMIVIDHEQRMAWAGGGGAWAHRMLEFAPTGGCCKECWVEKDHRASNLDPEELRKWLISEPDGPTIFRDGNYPNRR